MGESTLNIETLFNALPGAVAQGLIWGIMAIGLYITYKVLDYADLTVDGSMATLKKPKLLLLDEHTAALDPRTAEKVLKLSQKIISENHLMTMMVTHNMRDAIDYGNRLIMMYEGRIILDIAGEEKKRLTVEMLLEQFARASGGEFANDRALLS